MLSIRPRAEALYFRDISRYKLLTDQQERELVKKVQNNDKDSINELIKGNLRFVVSVARRYRGRGLTYLELINEGNIGLLKAARRFNLAKNVKFISYAVWWIRQSIQKAVFEQSRTIKIPPNKIALVNKFKKMLDLNGGDYNKTIMMDIFREHERDILEVMEKLRGISLETPVGSEKNNGDKPKKLEDVLGEAPNQDSESERKELRKVIDNVLQNVTSREERILRMYYGLNFSHQFTLDEIGRELKLTRERVRLIRDRSLRKLFRNPIARVKLYPFICDSRAE